MIKSHISKNGHPFEYYVEHVLDDTACAMVLMMDQAPPPSPGHDRRKGWISAMERWDRTSLRRPRAAHAGYPLRPCHPLQGQTTEADVTPRRPTRGTFWGRATPYRGRPHVLLDMLVIMTPFQPQHEVTSV